ncbi:hypothetical protein [Acinetobacter towneri]|uniref:hypothetical protein n=1 Tax=Acinetobacter towneri TaxID=202956 RepID=UPI001436A698|nr:hypothetical protein [Acinetobacter towneri]MCA4814125.1 hypothetical protein [Acinetobacter towneri]QIV93199.1 hypothetical protein GVU25_10605 [Acinetobacter towneri]
MNKVALLELASLLDDMEPKRFDMRTWRMPVRGKPGFVSDEQLINDTNTVACPVGWGCLLESWKQVGLFIDRFEVKAEHLSSPLSTPHLMSLVRTRLNDDLDSYEAVDYSLDLYPGTASVLFDPDNYADGDLTEAWVVADRIREICNLEEGDIMNYVVSYSD